MVGQIQVLGHGKTSSMMAGIMIISFHRPKVLTKTVCKFTAGFSNMQHATSLEDRIDHAGDSTSEPPFEVNTSARRSCRISFRRVVTGATPGSVAWKCFWWCLVLLRAGGKGTMDQSLRRLVSRRWTHKGWLLNMCAVVGSSLRMNSGSSSFHSGLLSFFFRSNCHKISKFMNCCKCCSRNAY